MSGTTLNTWQALSYSFLITLKCATLW
jgi:hypothetical protein